MRMAVARDMRSPRQRSSQRSSSGVSRMGVGFARRMARGDDLRSVAAAATVCRHPSHGTVDTSTITPKQQAEIAALIEPMTLAIGVGSEESACSVAAINLALTGELTDRIPDCMSEVIGSWIIRIQDQMPESIRNSAEWKRLLPFAAGTGRAKEQQRLALIMDWMWRALSIVQPVADAKGFGAEWAAMLREKTRTTAAAYVTTAAYATTAAVYATTAAYADTSWQLINPCGLLQELIEA